MAAPPKQNRMEKNEIRRKIKGLKAMLLETEKLQAAEEVFDRLEQLGVKDGDTVGMYGLEFEYQS